jgi:hypothetical protein
MRRVVGIAEACPLALEIEKSAIATRIRTGFANLIENLGGRSP